MTDAQVLQKHIKLVPSNESNEENKAIVLSRRWRKRMLRRINKYEEEEVEEEEERQDEDWRTRKKNPMVPSQIYNPEVRDEGPDLPWDNDRIAIFINFVFQFYFQFI